MIRHLLVVSLEFRIAGAILGLAALAALVALGDLGLSLHRLPPPDESPPLDLGTYGLVALLNNGAQVVGRLLYALASASGWLVAFLAVAAGLVLALAALLYLIGSGLGRQAVWARIVAGILSVAFAVLSAAAVAALRREPAALVPALTLALALHSLWTLVWRFE